MSKESQPYRPTMLGYKKKPELINPDSLLPAEKRKAQLDSWRTYDKRMEIIERQKAEEEKKKREAEEEAKRIAAEKAAAEEEAKAEAEANGAGAETNENGENDENKENIPVPADTNLIKPPETEPTENSEKPKSPEPNQNLKQKKGVKFHSDAVFLACCAADDMEDVTKMLANGQDVNTRNADGLTALHTACIDGKYKMCELLVTHKANINAADNEGWTPLHAAAGSGHLRIANFLVGHMANVEAVNCEGNMASDVTEDRACKLLLDGALLRKRIRNDEDKSKARRVEETMINQYVDEIYLKCQEQSANSTNNTNEEPDLKPDPKNGANILHVCASKGYVSALKILVQELKTKCNINVNLDARDEDLWTPLHAASHWEKQSCIDLLVNNGADLLAKNRFSQNPIDVMSHESPLYNHMTRLTEEAKKKAAENEKLRRIELAQKAEADRMKEALRLRELASREIDAEKAKNGLGGDDDANESSSESSASASRASSRVGSPNNSQHVTSTSKLTTTLKPAPSVLSGKSSSTNNNSTSQSNITSSQSNTSREIIPSSPIQSSSSLSSSYLKQNPSGYSDASTNGYGQGHVQHGNYQTPVSRLTNNNNLNSNTNSNTNNFSSSRNNSISSQQSSMSVQLPSKLSSSNSISNRRNSLISENDKSGSNNTSSSVKLGRSASNVSRMRGFLTNEDKVSNTTYFWKT